jgi:tetratricopeptide (TPR) repeat protein
MDLKQQIKTLIQEAELYRTQGLLKESKSKYAKIVALIKSNVQIKNRESLIGGFIKKIALIDTEILNLAKAPSVIEVPEKIQDLIKKQFAFAAKDEDSAAIEGAIALAKFGQFDRALKEFNLLLDKDKVRVVAAKNIIRCCMTHSSIENAVREYEQWLSGGKFTSVQLNSVRSFLGDILAKKGITQTLSPVPENEPSADPGKAADEELQEEEYLDISAIKITLDDGPQKGRSLEFDVNFQSGNVLSLIISSRDKTLIENLDVGLKLNKVQFFSPIAIFEGTGLIAEKTQIGTGPKRGDYSLDIKILSTN